MAPQTILIDRVRTALAGEHDVVEKKMFGSIAFLVRGKLCVAARRERILCRIDPVWHDEAIKREGCRTVVMKGRRYRGYVHVAATALPTKRALNFWIKRALDFNRSMNGK